MQLGRGLVHRALVDELETYVEAGIPVADVVAATNFSYFIFRERNELRHYFECARKNLKNEGVLVLDLMGGPQCHEEEYFERRRQDGFTYVWNHDTFNPINHHTICRIHFSFPDGSEMKNAFVYEWRLWTIPEISELLLCGGARGVKSSLF